MSLSTFLVKTRLWSVCRSLSERRTVSKPQILSRLRYVNIIKRCDETRQENAYRVQYESLQEWNNKYWADNNEMFNKEKSEYIAKNFDIPEEEALNHDRLAPFYRSFLERNRQKHIEYNRIWYRNHLLLLINSIAAKLSRLRAGMTNL